MAKEGFNSRLGFILVSAGCAIGLGNVWKFPYITGQYGGGLFVLIYIIFLILFGLPILITELTIGRGSGRTPAKMYSELEPKGTKWHWHSPFCIIGMYVLMMFYTVVTAWLLIYIFKSGMGDFNGQSLAAVKTQYNELTNNPIIVFIVTAIVVLLGSLVCSTNITKGLERVSKYMMLGLLVLIIALVVYSLTLSGAAEGLRFYLVPDIDSINNTEGGIISIIYYAMSQAFFTLSIGTGAIAIMGSYMKKDKSVLGEAMTIAGLDTAIAIMAGLIIFPACFTYGVEADAGPNLLFITMSTVFGQMEGGQIFGALFFIFMSLAALSTVFAVFEGIIASLMELTGWSRKRVALLHFCLMLILILPCILGFNVLSGFEPFGAGSNIMDLEDFIISNLLLVIGGLIMTLFCTWKIGWGWDRFSQEANTGEGMKLKRWMRPYCKYVLPLLIVIILVVGIAEKFQ